MNQLMTIFSKSFVVLIILALLLTCIPVSAEDAEIEQVEIIEISTIEELYNVRKDMTASYRLMNDIDLTEATAKGGDWDFMGNGWNPIGSEDVYSNTEFSGTFDGNGYSIIGMRIDVTKAPVGMGETAYLGLFANITGTLKNLRFSNASVSWTVSKIINAGIIAAVNSGTIEKCGAEGSIYAVWEIRSDSNYIGGICGKNMGVLSLLYNKASIQVENTYSGSYNEYVGGITAYNNGKIDNCYNCGSVTAHSYAAGICYTHYAGEIKKCYNSGKITAVFKYSIVGSSSKTVTNNYYLDGTGSGSTGSTALTEYQMTLQSMYDGFDFENIWIIDPDAVYPYPQLRDNIQDMSPRIDTLTMLSKPKKTEYFIGQELDLSGGIVRAVYASGNTKVLLMTSNVISVSGYDSNTVGEQTVTLTAGGASLTFTVTVSERPEITGIELANAPNKTKFYLGSNLDFTGAQVKINYADGSYELVDITVDMTVGADTSILGEQTVYVVVGDFVTEFIITVEIENIPADDGIINVLDLIHLKKHLADSSVGIYADADFNNDGEINANDLTALRKIMLGTTI